MPLTVKGKKVLLSFRKQYGNRGKEVFHAYIKKNPNQTETWHRQRSLKPVIKKKEIWK